MAHGVPCILSIYKFIHCFLAEGANGDGMAVVSSLRSFDREKQKEYLVPIVIKVGAIFISSLNLGF
jgi:hypothetical protein